MSRAVWCVILLGIIGFAWCSQEDRSSTPSCEDLGPQDIYLNFSHLGLNKLSKSFVASASIKCLNLQGNYINEINGEAFIGLPELRYLNLAGGEVPYNDFIRTALPNLTTLILDRSLCKDCYDYVDYSYELLDQRSFLQPELEKLSLSYYGPDNSIYDSLLTALVAPKLSHLYISGNGLHGIANLHAMSNLTTLYLDDNRMQFIPGEHFQNLEVLSMERNVITNLCWSFRNMNSWSLRGMQNLQHLSLAGNRIEVIESEAFVDMGNLVVLNLATNKIAYFPPHTFDNMTNLKNLTLDDNKLTAIPAICPSTKLEVISLNQNKISSIDETTFCSLQHLTVIRLSHNVLTSISDGSFADLPSLAELDLSWNKLHALSKKWIAPKIHLKFLNLDGNAFTDITNMSLEGIDSIASMSMGNNPIKLISVSAVMDLSPNITIDVSRIYLPPS